MLQPESRLGSKNIGELFDVQSGNFHATKELDKGNVPLISCGETNNGLVGYFDIPSTLTHQRAITVAYNGQPLVTKFHPYPFGAKDDVAVLVPRSPMQDTTLLYIAALLNRMTWRYSYGRKCFKGKLCNVTLSVPIVEDGGETRIDEGFITTLFSRDFQSFVPEAYGMGITEVPALEWRAFNIKEILDLERGDFHSIAALSEGEHMTVSRVTSDNGVVGYFELPDKARIFRRGHITVSTVGGDAFVQLDDFIATDNVIVCTPKTELRATTLFFIVFALNYQKWRYGYGRQCYQSKLERVNIYLPTNADKQLNEDVIEAIVTQSAYWSHIESRFERTPEPGNTLPKNRVSHKVG